MGPTKPRTKADIERHLDIKWIGCLPCMLDGWGGGDCHVECEIQHILDESGEKRLGHQQTWGGCPWHHRGVIKRDDYTLTEMIQSYGPSFELHRKDFFARYGQEAQLLELQNELIAEYTGVELRRGRWRILADYRSKLDLNPIRGGLGPQPRYLGPTVD